MTGKVLCFQIETVAQKLIKIAKITHYHFLKKEPLLIWAPSAKAVQYVDKLLWEEPLEGFLPHKTANEECQELIVITEKDENLNKAAFVINLTAGVPKSHFSTIYDFSETDKRALFEKKAKSYKDLGFLVEERPS